MRIALGWLGWSVEEATTCDINAIHVAYAGRREMLEAIFGKPKPLPQTAESPTTPPPLGAPLPKLTPQLFDLLFAGKKPKANG